MIERGKNDREFRIKVRALDFFLGSSQPMRGLDFELSTNRKPRFRMSKFKIEFENRSFDLISSFWTHSKVIPRLFWVIWQSFSIVLLICIIFMSSYHSNVILSLWYHSIDHRGPPSRVCRHICSINLYHSHVILSFQCHSFIMISFNWP